MSQSVQINMCRSRPYLMHGPPPQISVGSDKNVICGLSYMLGLCSVFLMHVVVVQLSNHCIKYGCIII